MIAEVAACKRLVDHDHARGVAPVAVGERAAARECDAERIEVSGRHVSKLDGECRRGRRAARSAEVVGDAEPAPVLERQHLREARGRHTGQLRHAIGNGVELVRIGARGHPLPEVKCHRVGADQPALDVAKSNQLADEQRATGGQQESQRDLCGHERVA